MFLYQLLINIILFLFSLICLTLNRNSLITTLMCIELILLSINLNFITFSVYFDDLYGQIFSLFILTVAAAESSLGIAITILYYRIRGSISLEQIPSLRY
jgi:NADH-quinone oxidoreductase subunit K